VTAPLPTELAAEAKRLLVEWERLWDCPGLERELVVEVSPRLRRSAARCLPERRLVRLAPFVVRGDRAVFREVLCHEAAHVVAYLLHGRAARAHGPEWRALVSLAGFRPRSRLPRGEPNPAATARFTGRLAWSPRCPVCQAVRLAARPVPRWRCRTCVEAGLEGRLVVERATTGHGEP